MYTVGRLWIFLASQLFGIAVVLLILTHSVISSSNSRNMQWHPVLMSLGMIYLMGSSITIYRGLSWMRKFNLKLIHGIIHISGLLFTIAGAILAFDSHNNSNSPHLRSLHSLFGIIAIVIYSIQWISGLYLYLYPKTPDDLKGAAMPVHIIFGTTSFVMGSCGTLIGLNNQTFGPRTGATITSTLAGFCVLIYLLMVLFLTMSEKYKRKPIPEA